MVGNPLVPGSIPGGLIGVEMKLNLLKLSIIPYSCLFLGISLYGGIGPAFIWIAICMFIHFTFLHLQRSGAFSDSY